MTQAPDNGLFICRQSMVQGHVWYEPVSPYALVLVDDKRRKALDWINTIAKRKESIGQGGEAIWDELYSEIDTIRALLAAPPEDHSCGGIDCPFCNGSPDGEQTEGGYHVGEGTDIVKLSMESSEARRQEWADRALKAERELAQIKEMLRPWPTKEKPKKKEESPFDIAVRGVVQRYDLRSDFYGAGPGYIAGKIIHDLIDRGELLPPSEISPLLSDTAGG